MNPKLVIALMASALLAGVLLVQPVFASGTPVMPQDTAIGQVLATPEGMTLYTFDDDAEGTSACTGTCAENWPPHLAPADAQEEGDYSVIQREDGQKQWAFRGQPLYRFAQDQAPGETSGDGRNGAWHAAKP